MSAHGSKKVIYAALIGNGLVSITKFVASFLTGSSAMLTEGIHSVIDTGNQVLLLFGMNKSKKPADEKCPFGYGQEVYFWSFIVAILIFAVGSGVSIYEGIIHIINPKPITNPMINYVVLIASIIFEGYSCIVAIIEFNKIKGQDNYIRAIHKSKDPIKFVVLFEDVAAISGLFVALAGVALVQLTGILQFDGIASVIIGIILGLTSIFLAYETKSLLIGESADPSTVNSIKEMVQEIDVVEHVNEVLTMHMGPEYILLNLSVDFRNDINAGDIENKIAEINKMITEKHPLVDRIFIEAKAKDN